MSSSYRAVNTLILSYKAEYVTVALGNDHFFSQNHTKDINTLCGHDVEFCNAKTGGA
jgi:hypothetical protein